MKNLFAILFTVVLGLSAAAQTSTVTFNVNMANETVAESGVFLGGGIMGANDAYQLLDADGDGIYSVDVSLANGTSGNYIFLNGNCPDWSCKENLANLPCADALNWNDRFLPEVTEDTTLDFCFGECSTDGSCSAAAVTSSVTFRVDMNDYCDEIGFVNFSGSANGWCGDCAQWLTWVTAFMRYPLIWKKELPMNISTRSTTGLFKNHSVEASLALPPSMGM